MKMAVVNSAFVCDMNRIEQLLHRAVVTAATVCRDFTTDRGQPP